MDNNKLLWLDDIRDPKTWCQHPGEVVWVQSYFQFVHHIKRTGLPKIISFDHDLAIEHMDDFTTQYDANIDPIIIHYETYTEKTGYDCVKWLVDYCVDNNLKLPECRFHTANPVGRANMKSYIENAKKHLGI